MMTYHMQDNYGCFVGMKFYWIHKKYNWKLCLRNDQHFVQTNELTRLPLGKMATILQTTFSNAFSWSMNENVPILIKISLKFVPKDPIYNNQALV